VYVAVGQKESTVASVVEALAGKRRDGLHDCREAPALQTPRELPRIAPYAAPAMAEYFMYTEAKTRSACTDDVTKKQGRQLTANVAALRPPTARSVIQGTVLFAQPSCWNAQRQLAGTILMAKSKTGKKITERRRSQQEPVSRRRRPKHAKKVL